MPIYGTNTNNTVKHVYLNIKYNIPANMQEDEISQYLPKVVDCTQKKDTDWCGHVKRVQTTTQFKSTVITILSLVTPL